MARYIQRISLFPYSAVELWVGWELEGVDSRDLPGLLYAEEMSERDLFDRGVRDFQRIPYTYLGDIQSTLIGEQV